MTLGEVILYVEDMESQVRFYRDILGLPIDGPIQDDYSAAHWVTFKTGACKLALHSGGRQSPENSHAVKFVLMVDNLHEARQRLISKGVTLSPVRNPAPGVSVCDAVDPEGNPFSLESASR
jgi:predicted enzyme related to lactoylglutathione lyase